MVLTFLRDNRYGAAFHNAPFNAVVDLFVVPLPFEV